MNIIFLLLPITLLLAAFFVWLFIGVVRSGQYDDLDTPAYRVLTEDD